MQRRDKKKGTKSFFKKALLVSIILLAVVLIFPIILFLFAPAILENLMAPKDLEGAKKIGDTLLKKTQMTILVVVAHPDDVDWYAGGTLHLLKENKNRIIVVLGTSGEKGGNANGDKTIREQEQLNSAKILGYDEVIFLRHPDRGLTADDKFKEELEEIIERFRPDILFTFDIEKEGYVYHHSDHRAAGRASIEVVKDIDHIKEIYLFHSRHNDVIVDISGVVGKKTEAWEEHKSQSMESLRKLLSFLPGRTDSFASRSWLNTNPKIAKRAKIDYCELFRKSK